MISNFSTNLRYSLRSLTRRPALAGVIVLTLALGIGMNVGIFSLFYQILLQPIPVYEPESLVALDAPGPRQGRNSANSSGPSTQVFSIPMFEGLRENSGELSDIAAYRSIGANLSSRGQTRSGSALLVSDNYFEMLGLVPAAGRLFIDGESSRQGNNQLVVLNHGYWTDEFDADPSVVGEALMVNGDLMTIIGVAPAGFGSLNPFISHEVYVPLLSALNMDIFASWDVDSHRTYWIYLMGRLNPGANSTQALASLNPYYQSVLREVEAPLQEGVSDDYMERFLNKELELHPGRIGQSRLHEMARQPMQLLIGVSLLVLLVACVNVANLLLAFGAKEQGEIAVRTALGAGVKHIIGRRFSQIAALGLIGGLCSIPVAIIVMTLFLAMVPSGISSNLESGVQLSMLLIALGVAALAIAIAGLIPLFQSLRVNPMTVIRDQNGQAGSSASDLRFRSILVVTQIAFSVCLLIVAGLFARSLANINSVDLGMEIDSLLSFQVSPEQNGYSQEQSNNFFQQLEDGLKALPGVGEATVSNVPLLSDSNWMNSVVVEGYDATPDTNINVNYNQVGTDFLDTMAITLLQGRNFTVSDIQGGARVAIVNQSFAERFEMGDDVVGKRISLDGGELDVEIVGLIADANYSSLKEEDSSQYLTPFFQVGDAGSAAYYVRTSGDPDQIADSVRSLVQSLDADLPVDNLSPLSFIAKENIFIDRLISTLALLFAVLATVLAAIGLYGVLTFMLSQRTREIGLRAALGASPDSIRGMILKQVAKLGLIGTIIGIGLAVVLARAAESLLFGMQPIEPLVFAAAVVILGLVIAFSGLLPARRASRIDPIEALRYE